MNELVYSIGRLPRVCLDYLNDNDIEVVLGAGDLDMETFKSIGEKISVLIFPDIQFPMELLKYLPNLHLIARCGVGIDNLPLDELTTRKIHVTNTEGVNADSVAELSVGLMLALSHKIVVANNESHKGVKQLYASHLTGSELRGKTVGLIGYGHIAKKVERLLEVFGTDILVANRSQKKIKYGCQVPFDTLICNADIVSLHIPLVKATANLIDETVLKQMHKETLLINTSRGGLINEQDLFKFLKNKEIGGAALDTLQNEPIGVDHPLLKLSNVIITPHIGAQTTDTIEKTGMMVAKEVVNFIETATLLHPVNHFN
ncbi:lactate dehydrogenase related dehydrogenase [Liquorilactobacillus aquaticus DSM 21051]|uniref:Lactate dehydrogenase related dehydrogenase n=1 Tax=Liquorilactobacillus aquaticus DSM 21051 TaxID=1423725 RepID=A0A0R2CUW6_9LACO|nr:NAD(P)-dependent oxidoreductase [Liquorilactobacillus aquaticus]KRM95114.1 lactate dehydrogenase related dehydrogenase [Liquorilactobacillus aquaticus DSM 21051]